MLSDEVLIRGLGGKSGEGGINNTDFSKFQPAYVMFPEPLLSVIPYRFGNGQDTEARFFILFRLIYTSPSSG